MSEYPFRFESSPKRKGTCPQCGQAHKFRYYEDLAGNRLEDFGRCDRTNTCGYHLVPSGKAVPKVEGTYVPPPQPVQIYPAGQVLERLQAALARADSPFHACCLSLGIPPEHLVSWRVGAEISRGNNLTVFVHQDAQGKLVNAKFVCYAATGKRSKDVESFSLKQPVDPLERYGMCLFGEHRLDPERRRPVMIVESEKSAVIASYFYPDFDWLATGSANGLTDAKIYPLTNRTSYWLADADGNVEIKQARSGKVTLSEGGRRNSSIRKLEAYGMKFAVIDLFPDRTDGYDIADAIGEGIRPDLSDYSLPTQPTDVAQSTELRLATDEPDISPAKSQKPKTTTNVVSNAQTADHQVDDSVTSQAKAHAVGVLFDAVLVPDRAVDVADSQDGPAGKKAKASKRVSQKEKYVFKTVDYRDGSIWIWGNKNWMCVADGFQLTIKYCTEDENEEKTWILQVDVRGRKEPIFVELTHEEFCSATKLKNKLVSHRLSFRITDNYLGALWQHLFELDFPSAMKVTRLGYHPGSGAYFFANKVVAEGHILEPDEFGIVTVQGQKEKLCLSMPVVKKKRQQLFTLQTGMMRFNQWFTHVAHIHEWGNAIIPACFYLMSLFRDLVVRHTAASPILYLKGGASSGKSSLIKSISRLFNVHDAAANLINKNTEAGLVRVMSETSNGLIWMDEFHNDFAHEGLLQSAYDNNGYIRAEENSSHGTSSVDIFSALALTSNYIPENPIFFSRCLFVPFVKTKFTTAQTEAFDQFRAIEENGLSCVTLEMLAHRPLIEQGFKQAYSELYSGLKKAVSGESVVERLIANMARVLTVAYILQVFGKIQLHFEVEGDDDILEEFISLGSKAILRQHQVQSEKTALSEFFELLQHQYEQGYLQEEIHFRFEGPLIFLRFPALYIIYAQRYKQTFYKSPADRDTLKQEMVAFEGADESYTFFKNIRFDRDFDDNADGKTKPVSGSCALTYSKLVDTYGIDWQGRRLERAER